MINRLIRWLYRRIEGAPSTPLDVLGKPPVDSGSWTLARIEQELRWPRPQVRGSEPVGRDA